MPIKSINWTITQLLKLSANYQSLKFLDCCKFENVWYIICYPKNFRNKWDFHKKATYKNFSFALKLRSERIKNLRNYKTLIGRVRGNLFPLNKMQDWWKGIKLV